MLSEIIARSIGDTQHDESEKQKIRVSLSRRESALAVGTISLERSRSKSATRGGRKQGRKKRRKLQGLLSFNKFYRSHIERASERASVLWRRPRGKEGVESVLRSSNEFILIFWSIVIYDDYISVQVGRPKALRVFEILAIVRENNRHRAGGGAAGIFNVLRGASV